MNGFTINGAAKSSGRFTLDTARTITVPGTETGERVGVGADRKGEESLVYAQGAAQSGMPLYAVALAIATGKVIPLDALAAAMLESGKVDHLRRALDKVAPPAPTK